MNNAANPSWLRSRRLASQGMAPQFRTFVLPQNSLGWDVTITNSIRSLPSWLYLAMVLVAATGICLAVNFRGRSQAHHAELQYRKVEAEISALKRTNAALQVEIVRVTTEPKTIESAARLRLGMVRPTDVIVPLQSRSGTNLATMSFIR